MDCKTPYSDVNLELDNFGFVPNKNGKEEAVTRFTWTNYNGVRAQAMTYGATILSIEIPDKNGENADIVFGFDSIDGKFGITFGKIAYTNLFLRLDIS